MKIVIDIDEDVRIVISRMGLLRIPDEMQKKVDKAIQHGTPLDSVLNKIRAEIKDRLYVNSPIFRELIDYRNGKITTDDVIEEFNRITRQEVLQIIDKHMKGGETDG